MASSSEDEEDRIQQEIVELRTQLKRNPYHYDSHIRFISTLKQAAELEQLRHARTKMQEVYPLTEELWLDWLRDEIELCTTPRARRHIVDLFELAILDYLSPAIWREYAEFMRACWNEMPSEKDFSAEAVCEVYERGVAAVGQHYIGGGALWRSYTEFRVEVVSHAKKVNAIDSNAPTAAARKVALQWVGAGVAGTEDAWVFAEAQNWVGDGAIDGEEFELARANAKKIIAVYDDLEAKLAAAEAPRLQAHRDLIAFEISSGARIDRVVLAYERAIADNALVAALWSDYATYLENSGGPAEKALAVYMRAIRNCPWVANIWTNYALLSERMSAPWSSIAKIYEQALQSGLANAKDYLDMYIAYAQSTFRHAHAKEGVERDQVISEWRRICNRGTAYITQYFGKEGDSDLQLSLYRARIEALHLNDIEAARETHAALLQAGHANRAIVWIAQSQLERARGTIVSCRQILRDGLSRVSDAPEQIFDALLTFERDAGRLSDLDESLRKINARRLVLHQRQLASAAKDENSNSKKRKRGPDSSVGDIAPEKRKRSAAKRSDKLSERALSKKSADAPEPRADPTPSMHHDAAEQHEGGVLEGHAPATDADIPPAPPAAPIQNSADDNTQKRGLAPPDIDPSTYPRTVFLKNLSFSATEEQIHSIFSVCGQIESVRLVRTMHGKSKGFAYVQFSELESVDRALAMDRCADARLGFRPVYVNRCEDRSKTTTTEENGASVSTVTNSSVGSYANDLERHKLYVSNLSFSLTEPDIRAFFEPFGTLKGVRLATKRSGASKGFAYVEFEDEKVAMAALVGANGQVLKGRAMEVAFSNPPKRSEPGGNNSAQSKGVPMPRASVAFKPRMFSGERKRPTLSTTKSQSAPTFVKAKTDQESTEETKQTQMDTNKSSAGAPKSNAYFASLFQK